MLLCQTNKKNPERNTQKELILLIIVEFSFLNILVKMRLIG